MAKIALVWVIGLAEIFAIILGFLGKFIAIVGSISNQVLGGVFLLLFKFIAVNGLKVLIENKMVFNNNKNIIESSTMLVLRLGEWVISIVSSDFWLLPAIIGILFNLFNKKVKRKKNKWLVEKLMQEI